MQLMWQIAENVTILVLVDCLNSTRFFKMKQLYITFFCILTSINLYCQVTNDFINGSVSFISSQNVYVQFVNTDGIEIGDTLFIKKESGLIPALVVSNLSSISCVGSPFKGIVMTISNQLVAKRKIEKQPLELIAQKSKEAIAINDQAIASNLAKKPTSTNSKSSIDGRVSLSSYLNNTSDTTYNNTTRFNLSFNANRIGNSKLSAECYMTLTNRNVYKPIYQQSIDTLIADTLNFKTNQLQKSNELKIYSLALRYDLDSTAFLTLGRKINTNLANIGAVDGFQFEKNGKNISYGAVIGSRPDTYSYGLNFKLLQYGAFIGYHTLKANKYSQTSVALFNQMNNMLTDRRFVYLQHSNSLLKNLDLFCSLEFDLYGAKNQTDSTKVQDVFGNDSTIMWNNRTPINMLDLTSAYVSLNYRPLKNLSMSLSYDARKNVYYYETYKSYVDSILDKETRQGLRLQTSYRPFKFLTWGVNAGYRFPSKNAPTNTTTSYSANANSYILFNLPFINSSLNFDGTTLKSNYFSNSLMYGGSFSTDFIDGKLALELAYHYVDFTYISSSKLQQNIGELSLSWRIAKKLILSADFEATQEINGKIDGRAFIHLSQRF